MGYLPDTSLFEIHTQWSMIRGLDETRDRDARWERFLRTYEPAIRTYVRRRLGRSLGRSAGDHEVDDAVQEFFARCLAGQWLSRASPEATSSFRPFLSTLLDRHLNDLRKLRNAKKRNPGGDGRVVTLENVAEPVAPEAEEEWDRVWWEALVERVIARVALDHEGYAEILLGLLAQAEAMPGKPWQRTRARKLFAHHLQILLAEVSATKEDFLAEWKRLEKLLPWPVKSDPLHPEGAPSE